MSNKSLKNINTTPVADLKNVHVRLSSRAGQVHILRGVNLQIGPGEQIGLVGPSGSGKSTLMMIMAGLERPTSGSVIMAGRDFSGLSEDGLADFRRDQLGIVFQSFHLVPTMTALENVALPLELAHDPEAFEKASEILNEVGLSTRLDHYPVQLSGGEQQRVALARALVASPPVLLADEPTGNLDQTTGHQIMDLIFRLTEARGTTMFLITHDVALAKRCQRVMHMRDGILEE
ncbi:ABC transporter ATP-binding protein [Alphaproteobacteria bacterium]|nr:ABC transporter ATP-binding protein [Alphaproteobacteria bacterium]